MSTAYRDVVVRIALKQIESELKAPDVKPTNDAIKSVSDTVKQTETEMTAAYDALQQEVSDLTAKYVDSRKAQEEAAEIAEKVADANIQAAKGFKRAGEGAFTAARGVAFLVAANEEEFQSALRVIAAAQGAFDIYKGAIGVVGGLTQARKALAAAAILEAKASTAATIATKGLLAIFNPLTIAIAAAAAAAYWLYSLWSDSTDAAEELEKAEAELVRTKKRVAIETKLQAIEDAEAAKAAKDRADAVRKAIEDTERTRRDSLRGLQGGGERLGSIGAEIASANSMKEQRDLLKEQVTLREQALQSQLKELDTRKKSLEAERDASASLEERIGRLSKIERLELEQLNRKAKAGNISAAEVRRAESLVGETDFTSKFFQDKGRASGGVGIASSLTGISQGSSEIGDAANKIEEQSKKLEDGFKRFTDTNRNQQERLINAMADAANVQTMQQEYIEKIERQTQQTRQNLEKSLSRNQSQAAGSL